MTEPGDWHIDSLNLQNYRCFSVYRLTFDPSLTVLVGVNGSGKTSILDSLAVMLSTVIREFGGDTRGFSTNDAREVSHDLRSQESVARMERIFPIAAKAVGTLAGSNYTWVRQRISAKGRTTWADKNSNLAHDMATLWNQAEQEGSTPLPVLAAYGVERLIGVRRAAGAISRSRAGAYDTAMDGRSNLSRLSTFIKGLTLAEFAAVQRGQSAPAARSQLQAIKLACNAILEGTGWGDPEWSSLTEEITLTHPEKGSLPLSFLSSGIKISAGLVIDLVSRMARANPGLGSETLLNTVPGIVLVDEIDLHLHPTWQQQIIPKLLKVFPRIQFIVSTHSPQVLSTVEAKHIRIIDETGVRHVDYSAGLRSDIILDRVLDTSPRPHLPINTDFDEYIALVDGGQGLSPRAKKLRSHLNKELGGIESEPELADADTSIAFYDLEG